MEAEYRGITVEGIEDIAAEEVGGKVIGKRRVLFSMLKENIRTISAIYKLEKALKFDNIEEIIATAEKIPWKITPPFRVTCRREGVHLFTANDVEKVVGEVIYNLGYPVNLKKPTMTVFVDIVENQCILGILVYEALEKRAYRVKRNSTGVDACIAAALIKYTDIQPQEAVYDPFCRDGVIAIEAMLAGIKNVHAGDSSENNLRSAKVNAKMAKVSIIWEEKNEIPDVEYVIAHIRLSRREGMTKEYLAAWFKSNAPKVKKRIVIITNWKHLEKIMPEEWNLKEKREVAKGQQKNYLIKFEKLVQ